MKAFCHGKKSDCLACYRHDACVKLRNRFESQDFAGFWLRIEQQRAEHDYLRNWGTGVFSRSHRKKEGF